MSESRDDAKPADDGKNLNDTGTPGQCGCGDGGCTDAAQCGDGGEGGGGGEPEIPASRNEMNTICRAAADMALELLETNHGIVPFAIAILKDNELEMVTPDGESVGTGGEDTLEAVRKKLQAGVAEERFFATAVVSDVRVRPSGETELTDALRIELEHADDIPITCFLPYKRLDDQYEHGKGYLEDGDSIIFEEK